MIIDGPAGTSRVSAEAVRAADLVLIPAKPSPYDVWAASDIVEAVKARRATSGGATEGCFCHHHVEAQDSAGRPD